jgi:hypothetical protein
VHPYLRNTSCLPFYRGLTPHRPLVGVQQEYLDGKNVEGKCGRKTWEHWHGHMHTLHIHMCYFQSRQFHHPLLRRQVLMVGFVAFLCRFACVGVVSNHGSESSGCEFDIRCSYKARKAPSGYHVHTIAAVSYLPYLKCAAESTERGCVTLDPVEWLVIVLSSV